MKDKIIYLIVLICILASCNDIMHIDDENLCTKSIVKTQCLERHMLNYSVNEELLQRYIHLVNPNKTIQNITPILRNDNDTLAYVVQYSQGWDLVSGDTRMPPRLAFAETGELDMDEYETAGIGGINGMIDLVQEKKASNDTVINNTWKFLSPKSVDRSYEQNITTYGDVAGMWVPIDTQYIDNYRHVSRIIDTQWHQDNPYNDICPLVNLGSPGMVRSLAGCGPIAFGQVIYHFLKSSNPDSVSIPKHYGYLGNKRISFSDFSTSQWQKLSTRDSSFSIFITFLGQNIMNASYIPYISANSLRVVREVGVDSIHCRMALDWAHLQYDQCTTYNWQNIVSSLLSGYPILVLASDTSRNYAHAFIIDALKINDAKIYVTYQWDENYQPDFWELQRNPAWMFEPSIPNNDGKCGESYQEEIVLEDDCAIAMNWGYGSSTYDNIYYTIRVGSSIIAPSWRVQNTTYSIIDKIFYNVRQ